MSLSFVAEKSDRLKQLYGEYMKQKAPDLRQAIKETLIKSGMKARGLSQEEAEIEAERILKETRPVDAKGDLPN